MEQIPIVDGLKAKVGEQRVSTAVQCRRKPVPIELSQFWRKAFRFNPLFEILCKAGLIKVDECFAPGVLSKRFAINDISDQSACYFVIIRITFDSGAGCEYHRPCDFLRSDFCIQLPRHVFKEGFGRAVFFESFASQNQLTAKLFEVKVFELPRPLDHHGRKRLITLHLFFGAQLPNSGVFLPIQDVPSRNRVETLSHQGLFHKVLHLLDVDAIFRTGQTTDFFEDIRVDLGNRI